MEQKKQQRSIPKGKVKVIVRREFMGETSVCDALLPVIFDDIKARTDARILDKDEDND